MLPLRISNATRILAEGQDEYHALAILDERDESGVNHMTSVWEPTPAELEDLKAGGAVRLTIIGGAHPPVMITTQPPPEWERHMTEEQTIAEMRRIELQLMILGNNAYGNSKAFDAILAASAALRDFTEAHRKDCT